MKKILRNTRNFRVQYFLCYSVEKILTLKLFELAKYLHNVATVWRCVSLGSLRISIVDYFLLKMTA